MTSAINPNNIDGSYPIAGQDNNSQGFRDNFTNTKTNFQYAADEITDLENKAVLKAALTGTTLNNNMGGSLLSNAQLQDMSETRVALGTLSGSVTVNYEAGSVQTVTTNGSISLAFSNWPAAGAAGTVAVQITVTSVAHTITFPSAVSVNTAGIPGLNASTNTLTVSPSGVYTFAFTTSNGGSTITIDQTNNSPSAWIGGYNQVTNGNVIDLTTTTTYFTVPSTSTVTLPDGVNGQLKVLVATSVTAAQEMIVNCANFAWAGSGTITFDTKGQTAIVMFLSGEWYALGGSGAVFG
jgi:hypothetical protein